MKGSKFGRSEGLGGWHLVVGGLVVVGVKGLGGGSKSCKV